MKLLSENPDDFELLNLSLFELKIDIEAQKHNKLMKHYYSKKDIIFIQK